jgi:hypothetical protein
VACSGCGRDRRGGCCCRRRCYDDALPLNAYILWWCSSDSFFLILSKKPIEVRGFYACSYKEAVDVRRDICIKPKSRL